MPRSFHKYLPFDRKKGSRFAYIGIKAARSAQYKHYNGVAMKRRIIKLIVTALLMVCFSVFPANGFADTNEVYLGGIPAGFSLYTRGVTVVGIADVVTENGKFSPGKDAGLQIGDVITFIDDKAVNSSEDIAAAVDGKSEVKIKYTRNGESAEGTIKPKKDALGQYKLGLFIRNFVSGIGTLTYVKNNRFTSLGHPIVDENGSLIEIIGGSLINCTITGAIRGERGKAGELKGIFLKNTPFAQAERNTPTGVTGIISDEEIERLELKKVETGKEKVGAAVIYSTVKGSQPKEYAVSVVKIDKNEKNNKNLVLKINDEELLSVTGGIVQGMSGSPILQDGKLVGAVTHVFVNDPERGFGISVENFIEK